MTKTRIQIDVEKLVKAPDYRAFLGEYFSFVDPVKKRPISFAEFGRKAGFQSRSYPRDVTVGKRRLTAKTLPQFAHALGLSAEWREYFRLLVALDEPDVIFEAWSKDRIQEKLKILRKNLLRKTPRMNWTDSRKSSSLFKIPHLAKIYAALGAVGVGATLEEIYQRTGLNAKVVSAALEEMKHVGIAKDLTNGRWTADTFHFSAMGSKDQFFKALYQNSLEEAKKASDQYISSNEHLFFTSSVCVQKSDLLKMKKELQDVLLKYVDDAENPDGDRVVNLSCGLYL
ncbi:MAG: TIGR02147 family protein [Pseudobdellovibrionaceae bacterium]